MGNTLRTSVDLDDIAYFKTAVSVPNDCCTSTRIYLKGKVVKNKDNTYKVDDIDYENIADYENLNDLEQSTVDNSKNDLAKKSYASLDELNDDWDSTV